MLNEPTPSWPNPIQRIMYDELTGSTLYSAVARLVQKYWTNSGNNMPLFIRLIPPINGPSLHISDPGET